jgi:hypothetical protein
VRCELAIDMLDSGFTTLEASRVHNGFENWFCYRVCCPRPWLRSTGSDLGQLVFVRHNEAAGAADAVAWFEAGAGAFGCHREEFLSQRCANGC